MKHYDVRTGFLLGDPEIFPFPPEWQPKKESLKRSMDSLILSASGWRKVFAADGDEESPSPELSPEDALLTALMGAAFGSFLKEKTTCDSPLLLLGVDSRPTGQAMADILIRVFLGMNIRTDYSFITAAPELMARAQGDPHAHGFAYISASHNPLGHNGLKFGLSDGGVLGGNDAARLIENYKSLVSDPNESVRVMKTIRSTAAARVEAVFTGVEKNKKLTEDFYQKLTRRVVSGQTDIHDQEEFFTLLESRCRTRGIGILGELNGSARCLSIDRDFLNRTGVAYRGINDKPRQITHRIVPEGPSLDLCREELDRAFLEDPRFILGYVPDNDGDRGNLVYHNSRTGRSEILEAQEVFALSVLGELAFLDWLAARYPGEPELSKPRAVAVNGPTSLRIEAVSRVFGAEVFRAEVGEANVVNRAREARDGGFCVPILGEGSNGGNITYPAAVRDPLNTLFALLKLLLITREGNTPGLFESWCVKSGRPELFYPDFTLTDIIDSLPAFTTTSAFEKQALMKIRTQDHGILKSRYEDSFPAQWEKHKKELKTAAGITDWEEVNYEGTRAVTGTGSACRSGSQRGGLKINLLDKEGLPAGFIWMRGSGTEPVFRLMADIRGSSRETETLLLSWQRRMIEEADRG